MQDSVQAFSEIFRLDGNPAGPLSGRTFGAKDLFDIAGHQTGCGNPDWAATHEPALTTAPAVQALLDAGATLLGKTHTDELAYSLMGVNAHYGTPLNTAAPDRVPGGSSSGSVAATAAGLVDIGLGTDTGGSVRLPASFSGVYGIRTTHGRLSLAATMALAPSFDTLGWFARDPHALAQAGEAYGIGSLEQDIGHLQSLRLIKATDAFELASVQTQQALGPGLARLEDFFATAQALPITNGSLTDWRETFRVCQAAEIWQEHGEWIRRSQPDFGPGVRERFEMAASITSGMTRKALDARAEMRNELLDLMGNDGLLVLPTSPGPAPLRDADETALGGFRQAALELLSPAGLAGLPQISIPVGMVDGAPVGLSMIAPAGRDEWLLGLAQNLFSARP
ncbi:MAG: amidase [Gammaproteobacteria bacterium]|nr:amidase [Gammaproteobacteria bacterium]